ncbi:ApbE family protein [Salegentibacter sp. 24]|uniref:FAD:protein FMN transferase n=1 Tax=Salegentibacter sp. 24 TaxID=2183986 RepID=UPI00105B55D0|nr:FAD:protein FMN transferase [Salegentibacter sp. 24]TDN94977.1 ApbE family protein [Salegentibacter sp. 24]
MKSLLRAIGEGYYINKIADFLNDKGVENYKVELGGEVKTRGYNGTGKLWKIGIENPYFSMGKEKDRFIHIITLKNTAISTSGSYRKFYLDSSGKRRPHIINPETGSPVDHSLLSVSIKCKNAEKADAMATACMVLGQKTAMEPIAEDREVEGLLIYDDNYNSLRLWKSEGF